MVEFLSSKNALSKIAYVGIAILAIIVISVAIYYASTPAPTTPTTPTSPTTPTPTMTLTTETRVTETTTEVIETTTTKTIETITTEVTTTAPAPTPIVNMRTGSYARYHLKFYTAEDTKESYLTFKVEGETVHNNIRCWLLSQVLEMEEEGRKMKQIITWWISKLDSKAIHARIQVYLDNVLMYEREYDLSEIEQSEQLEAPKPFDVNYFVSYETIRVQAGVFVNCIRVDVSDEEYYIKTWYHESVPIYGLVKSEAYKEGKLLGVTELVSYGG